VVADDDVDAEVGRAPDRRVVAHADVARHDQPRPVGGGALGRGDAEAVSFVEAARNVVGDERARAEHPQRVLQDDRGGRAVDVVVGDDPDRLAPLDRRAHARDGPLHAEHLVRVVEMSSERGGEKGAGHERVRRSARQQDSRDGRRDVDGAREPEHLALVGLGDVPARLLERCR
jgi:hypothetical protein